MEKFSFNLLFKTMKIGIFLSFLCFSAPIFAQSIKNVKTYQEGNNVVISYLLQGKGTFEVTVRPSDQGQMSTISGDIGKQKAGLKRIVWDVLKDRPSLDAQLYFDLEAVHTPPMIDLEKVGDGILDIITIDGSKKKKKKNE